MGNGIFISGFAIRRYGVFDGSYQKVSPALHRKRPLKQCAAVSASCTNPTYWGLGHISGFTVGALYLSPAAYGYAMPLLLSCTAVFIGGLGEDIGRDVSPKARLALSFLSAACAIMIFQTWIGPLGTPYLNWITASVLGGTLFTILISGGIAHAINLIDGLNGLAMGVCMLIAGGLALLANSVGNTTILQICVLLICSILGLFVFNFHLAKFSWGMQVRIPWGTFWFGFQSCWCLATLRSHPMRYY